MITPEAVGLLYYNFFFCDHGSYLNLDLIFPVVFKLSQLVFDYRYYFCIFFFLGNEIF